ncbi:MAG: MarR family transcriptional regulator [Alkalispirochaeta sp.]
MTGNQAYQKSINQALVMRAIRDQPGISRTEIAVATGLTKSTVGNLARQLQVGGLIRETGSGERGGAGRPRVGLVLAAGVATVIGIELRRDEIFTVTLDLTGAIVDRRCSRDHGTMGPFGTLQEAWQAARALVPKAHVPSCVGIGVAVPATTDPIRGVVVESEDFDVSGFHLESLSVVDAVVPVLLENDANAVAWGAIGGTRATTESPTGELLVVTGRFDSSRGVLRVGTGIVLGHRVFYGEDFGGGEFRSVRWRRGMSGELAERGGTGRAELVELCENLSVAVSMLRPRRVIVAGDLVGRLDEINDILTTELAGAYVDPRVSGVPFVSADDGEFAVASGAAHMFREHLFEIPGVDRSRPQGIPQWQDLTGA